MEQFVVSNCYKLLEFCSSSLHFRVTTGHFLCIRAAPLYAFNEFALLNLANQSWFLLAM